MPGRRKRQLSKNIPGIGIRDADVYDIPSAWETAWGGAHYWAESHGYSKDANAWGESSFKMQKSIEEYGEKIASSGKYPAWFKALFDGRLPKKTEEGVMSKAKKFLGEYKKENSQFPELDKVSLELAHMVAKEINKRVKSVESKMPYKAQYVLEELIRHLEEMV